jgi:hypothetical protein
MGINARNRIDPLKSWVAMLLVAGVLVSCSSPRELSLNGDFQASSRNGSEVLAELNRPQVLIQGLSGRARAQYSGPGSSERSTVIFESDRVKTLMTFRNNLGIEGGKLYIDADSVTWYNRIDQVAQRVSVKNTDVLTSQGLYAVNLLKLLNPDFKSVRPRRVYENETSWRMDFDDRNTYVFDKNSGDVVQMEQFTLNNFAFSTYIFGSFAEVNGYRLPRNIQVTTKDRRSTIFLSIGSYEVNPARLDFNLDLPSHVRIDRP